MSTALLAALAAALAGALPPPPTQVVLTGHGTFGEIHFDHAAHLARRISCTACHGPGPVHKPELTPGVAHETCRACHVREQRGPTSCRDCHVNVKGPGMDPEAARSTVASASANANVNGTPTPTPTSTSTSTPTSTPTATSTPTPTPTSTATSTSTSTSTPTPTATPTSTSTSTATSTATSTSTATATSIGSRATARAGAGGAGHGGDDPDAPVRAAFRAGLSSISGSARAGAGMSVAGELEQGSRVVGLEVDWTTRPGAERTLALAAAGLSVPWGRDVRARAMLLGGVDAGAPAYVLPAVGARLALELRGRSRFALLPSAQASVGWVTALGTRYDAGGARTREAALVFALSLGWELPGR